MQRRSAAPRGLVQWARRDLLRLGLGLVNPEDMTMPRHARTADDAMAILCDQAPLGRLAQA